MRVILFACCLILLAAPIAEAKSQKPAPGSVSCRCVCVVRQAIIGFGPYKVIGGRGQWTKTRDQCKAFSGATCRSRTKDGKTIEGKLKGCDTIVHSLPPPGSTKLQTAPTTGNVKAPPSSSGTGTGTNVPSKTLKKLKNQ